MFAGHELGSIAPYGELPVLRDLRKFLGTRKERGAVEIERQKWMVSYRFTFPSEPVWRKAFEKDQMR